MTDRVTIRPYDPETDADFLRRAAPRLYSGPTAAPRDPEQFAAFFERFVALDENGEAAALLALHQDHDHFVGHPRAYVDIVVVDAAAEGRGLARALMAHAEAWARGRGCREVCLDVFAGNERAMRFYASCGFRPDHVRMAKAVSAE